MNPLNQRFAENLVLLRQRADLSEQETAERAGLHRTGISLLERGLRLPQLDTIVQLAGGVEAEPCELLAGMAWRLPIRVEQQRGGYVRSGSFELDDADRQERV